MDDIIYESWASEILNKITKKHFHQPEKVRSIKNDKIK
jgi:hypothetical protein